MPTRPPPERARASADTRSYRGQRAFAAWSAAIYTFVVMLLGTLAGVTTIFGKTDDSLQLLFMSTLAIFLLIPNAFIAAMIWSKIFHGDEV